MCKSKQVIVMRKDLNMRKGKMVSQGSHASLKVFFDKMKSEWIHEDIKRYHFLANMDMVEWIDGEFTKITVYVKSEEELLEIHNKAKQSGIPCSLIKDKGHTEFNGVETYTCCAIGPDSIEKVDIITSHLPLL